MKKLAMHAYMNLMFFLFNNTRSFKENWRLHREYDSLRKGSTVDYDPIIFSKGYIEDVAHVSFPASFPDEVAQLFEGESSKTGTTYQSLSIERRLLLKEDLIQIASQLKPMAERYFGSKCRIHWVVVSRLNCSERVDGDSTFWHSDNCPVGSLKAMVFLKPVSEDLGGQFEIMDRAQSRSMQKHGWIPDSLIKSRKDLDTIVARHLSGSKKYSGTVGDVVWFDNNVLHKGNSPRVVPRDTLLFQFYPAASDYGYLSYLEHDKHVITTAPASFLN